MQKKTRRPATGERRKTNQPLKIDRLGPEIHAILQHLKNERGLTWQEIESLSAEKFDKSWSDRATWWKAKGGFVDWEQLPTRVLELFPDMRLPRTNLHRWYDLRVSQVTAETLARSLQARELAAAFTKSVVAGDDAGVLNAARDQLMSLLAEDASSESRLRAAKSLIALAEVQNEANKNKLRARQVGVQEKALQMKLDEVKRRAEKLMASIEKADGKNAPQLTREQLLDRVKEIYGAV